MRLTGLPVVCEGSERKLNLALASDIVLHIELGLPRLIGPVDRARLNWNHLARLQLLFWSRCGTLALGLVQLGQRIGGSLGRDRAGFFRTGSERQGEGDERTRHSQPCEVQPSHSLNI